MEGIEMDTLDPLTEFEEDLCTSILAKFGASVRDDHQHLCVVAGTMAQELKDRNIPLSPVALFGATVSSLDRLSSQPQPSSESPDRAVDALLTILAMIVPRISVAVLRSKGKVVLSLLTRVSQSKLLSPEARASVLQCYAKLLEIRDALGSDEVFQVFGCLLNSAIDAHPKIRKQSHSCIRDVLQSFQGTPLLVHASSEIKKMLEKLLLLAGGSQTSSSEGPKGAQEVLYILDMLKDCLPSLSMKYKSIILEYYKSLLELRQPFVTRRVTDSLNMLCIHPTSEVSPEALLDLLCSLAVSVSTNETSADGMTFTARLLDSGMRKIYAMNRELCVAKLPIVFSSLRDILAFEYAEALIAATDAMKSLIEVCVDDDLIKQRKGLNTTKSVPTTIEKVCASIGSLLDYQYSASWDLAFQVLSAMFDKLGESSFELLGTTLKGLADLQELPDEDFPYRKQLHECFGVALGAMGPANFLSVIPLGLEAEDLSKANVWLFPILKQYTVGAQLNFFVQSLLGYVRHIKRKSEKLKRLGRNFSSQVAEGLVYSLWSLLPSFCNYPQDLVESFDDLKIKICNALTEEPSVRGIICSALQVLIQQNKLILRNDTTVGKNASTRRAMALYTQAFASNNLHTLKSSTQHMLLVLSKVFFKSSSDSVGCLLATISEFASISEGKAVSELFVITMNKLLKATEDNVRAQHLDLAVSLLPGLSEKEIYLLFVAIKPAVMGTSSLIQKKGYKVLLAMLQGCESLLSNKLEELLQLMIETLPSCQSSAKRHRLNCLLCIITHVSKNGHEQSRKEVIGSFLTEIILALKEANKKTRNMAYDLIVQIGHACGDGEQGGTRESLLQFFNMVAGGMAGESPHMISAAVKGLARLAYEFSDLVSTTYNILPSTFLLFQRKNREITKANLGLVKVLVAKSHAESLQTHLKGLVEAMLKWGDDTRNHFKAKVKHLLEMLVKRCGLDAVKAVMPEEHMKLLTNIRKIKERRERKQKSKSETGSVTSKATTSRLSKWNHTRIFSDFGDDSDADYMDDEGGLGRSSMLSSKLKSRASTLKSKRNARSLPNDVNDQMEDEPLDLLDQQRTRTALRSGAGSLKRKAESKEEFELDPDGRLIIHDEEDKKSSRKMKRTDDEGVDERSEADRSYLSGTSNKKAQKKRKTSESGWAYTGNEYASKKASGDVKRKGKLEPYAYWPLDRKLLSRRREHRVAATRGMQRVVRLTKNLEGRSAAHAISKLSKGHKKRKSKQN